MISNSHEFLMVRRHSEHTERLILAHLPAPKNPDKLLDKELEGLWKDGSQGEVDFGKYLVNLHTFLNESDSSNEFFLALQKSSKESIGCVGLP